MNSREWARVVGLVRAASGVRHTHRLRTMDLSVTQNSQVDQPILTCDDDPDYDEDFDFAGAAPECSPGSRIVGLDLNLEMVPGGGAGERMEFILYKSPDALLTFGLSNVSMALLFTNDLTSATILLRKHTLAIGTFVNTTTKDKFRSHIRISSGAMKRNAIMHDGDQLRMLITHTAASSNGTASLYGRIWTRTG